MRSGGLCLWGGPPIDLRAQIPTLPDNSPPWLALAAILAAVLIAFAPLLLSRSKKKHGREDDDKPAKHAAAADAPTVALPAAVDRSGEMVGRLVDGLERRAQTAEQRMAELQDEFDAARQAWFNRHLELQRELDAARAEISSLRTQLQVLTYRRGSGETS